MTPPLKQPSGWGSHYRLTSWEAGWSLPLPEKQEVRQRPKFKQLSTTEVRSFSFMGSL